MKYLLVIATLFLLSGCEVIENFQSGKSGVSDEQIWVFAQFNVVEEKDGLETYYYYGEVSKNLYEKVNSNEIKRGFILLENVRYWSDGSVYAFEDDKSSGELVFKIEDIAKLELLKSAPALGERKKSTDTVANP